MNKFINFMNEEITITLTKEEVMTLLFQVCEPCKNPTPEYTEKLNEIIAKVSEATKL